MIDSTSKVKGFTYDLDLQRDSLRKIEIVLHDDSQTFTFEHIHFDRDRIFEFYSAWKNFAHNQSAIYRDKLKLASNAYVLFEVIDNFEGRVTLVLEQEEKVEVAMPIFFMEFESFIDALLEEDLAYEFSE